MQLTKPVTLDEIKGAIKANIESACSSFNSIGYYLKDIRDRELYLQEGYNNVWELAQAEFGISKSSASRFMAINDKFSEQGNSPLLLEKYKGFSSSKLSEMLTLSVDQLEEVTESTTVKQIREMKHKKEELDEDEFIPGQKTIEDYPEYLPDADSVATSQHQLNVSEREMVRYSVPNKQTLYKLVNAIKEGQSNSVVEILKEVSGNNFAGEWYFARFSGFIYMIKGSNVKNTVSWNKYIELVKEEFSNHFIGDVDTNLSEVNELKDTLSKDEELTIIDAAYKEVEQPEIHDKIKNIVEAEFMFKQTNSLSELMNNTIVSIEEYITKNQIEIQSSKEDEIEYEEKNEQPELPLLKNNDQRKEWIEKYREWPLWSENNQTGERYYRYDFEDGISFVISDHLVHTWEKGFDKYQEPAFRAYEYYIIGRKETAAYRPKNPTFYECKENKSAMIDYLKEYQKK